MTISKYLSEIIKVAVIIITGLTSLPACGKITGDATTTIVLVHGLKGAFLQDPSADSPCWLSVSVAQGLRNCQLALPTRWSDNQQQRDNNRSIGIFDKFVIIPGLVEIDFYGGFIEAMEKQGAKVKPFN